MKQIIAYGQGEKIEGTEYENEYFAIYHATVQLENAAIAVVEHCHYNGRRKPMFAEWHSRHVSAVDIPPEYICREKGGVLYVEKS